ncbi:hypothetical protein Hydth_0566 [Hydrogenobacter thermophilus TK-6]|uniref:Uncharacterized protein n=1 Tax=Hydrogenobacter thermophilus (strain DSM 6534 / IAM 12695 / TK-6) TaxID=608538 RepID=D3DGS7_HYDTT|nr:hypothetical protein [Hydrogenobacter thermophilus]ADO44965.1 hypothetical protein Hydth_0566 [Hydrogenobacter thermophilus TK-6]BAI69029.1 hypothetical protein HTH_0567 [Hydrogenobacter thermophilus TK-6]
MKVFLLSLFIVFLVFRSGEGWSYRVLDKANGRFIIMVQLTDTSFLQIEFAKDGIKLQELLVS